MKWTRRLALAPFLRSRNRFGGLSGALPLRAAFLGSRGVRRGRLVQAFSQPDQHATGKRPKILAQPMRGSGALRTLRSHCFLHSLTKRFNGRGGMCTGFGPAKARFLENR